MRRLAIVLAILLVALPVSAKPLRVGGEVKAPFAVKRIKPKLPEHVRVSGSIVLSTVINTMGNVRKVRVVRDPTKPPLGKLYAEAVKQWVFIPATLHGEPVEVEYTLVIHVDVQ